MYFYLKILTSISCYVYFMLCIFCTGLYYIICPHFTLATTCAYAFHYNVIYMCFYFKILTSISCYIYFVRDHIT